MDEHLGQPSHDVFVSYSTSDKPVADAIVARLEQAGVRCWVAPRDVLPGTFFSEDIVRAIRTSRLMVTVVSSHANRSPNVIREVGCAVECNVVVVPFRIEPIELTEAMSFYLATEHWLDAVTPPLEAHIAELVKVVQALIASAPQNADKETPAGVPRDTAEQPPPPSGKDVAPPVYPGRKESARRILHAAFITGVVAAVLILATVAIGLTGNPNAPSPSTPEHSPPSPVTTRSAPATTKSAAPTTTSAPQGTEKAPQGATVPRQRKIVPPKVTTVPPKVTTESPPTTTESHLKTTESHLKTTEPPPPPPPSEP